LTSQGGPSEDELQMMQVNLSRDEPAGLRFYKMQATQEQNRVERIKISLRQVLWIMIYMIVAQLFYSYLIKPWNVLGIEDAEHQAAGVQVVSKIVLLLNFAIQTAVMVDIEDANFVRMSRIDMITFIWNTILLVATLGYTMAQTCHKSGFRLHLLPRPFNEDPFYSRDLVHAVKSEIDVVYSMKDVFIDQTLMLYILGEVGNVIAPVIINFLALRWIYILNIGGSHTSGVQRVLRSIMPKMKRHDTVTPREAEKAQSLAPFALWMEYSYIIVFPFIAFPAMFFVGPSRTVSKWLVGFSIIFFIWQRYVMVWLYRKVRYDGTDTYTAFIVMWGFVISLCSASWAWWSYRLGSIMRLDLTVCIMVGSYALALLVYWAGILVIDWIYGFKHDKQLDEFASGQDPGYASLVEFWGLSWWNLNPIYVLKQRYCPETPGFEVHTADVKCWPSWSSSQGWYEVGKSYRHRKVEAGTHRASRPVDC